MNPMQFNNIQKLYVNERYEFQIQTTIIRRMESSLC